MKIKTVEYWENEGDNFKANTQYEKAIVCYNKSIEFLQEYNSKDGYYKLTNLYEEVGKLELKSRHYQSSIITFTKAIDYIYSDDLFFFRGLARYEIGDYKEAIKDFEEADSIFANNVSCEYEGGERRIKRNPKLAEIRKCIGYSKFKIGEYYEAFDCYYEAIELIKDIPNYYEEKKRFIDNSQQLAELYMTICLANFCLGDWQKSILHIDKAIELDSNDAKLYIIRKIIRYVLNDYQGAFQDYEKAVELLHRNVVHLLLNDYEEKALLFLKTIHLPEKSISMALIYRGLSKYKLGNIGDATNDFQEAIKLIPFEYILDEGFLEYTYPIRFNYNKHRDSNNPYDYIFAVQNNVWGNFQNISKEFELEPDVETSFFQGIMKSKFCDYRGAIKEYDNIIATSGNTLDTSEAYELRGDAKIGIRDFRKAIQDYDKSIEIFPDTSSLYYKRGKANFFSGGFQNTILDFNKFFEKSTMNYGYIEMAILFVKLNQYDKAVRSFVKSRENILSVFTILREHKTIDEIKQIASFFIPLLAEDVFFNSIIKPVKENIEPYRELYINSMLIISFLYVDFKDGEEFVATYTNEDVVNALLLKDSPLRLSLSIQSNDLLEGQCLLDYLYPEKDLFTAQRENLEDKENFGSFITCFTFNQDHLNHFRLYGNKNNIQASGISLIFDKYLFANNHISIDTYTVEYSGQSKNTESTHKLPLFRCIYLDPSTGFIASVGHREEQTFYKSKKDMEKVEEYKKKIKKILEEVRTELTQMKKDVKILDSRIVGQLLLPLRYLIKHIDFKEEQECRIFSVKAKCESKKEGERNYFDYLKIKHHIKEIILGAKCLEDKNAKKQFMDDIKKTGITNIKRSRCPFV